MKEQDYLQRFVFEHLGIRGEWVRLQDSWKQTKQNQQLSEVVQEQLGQALAAVVLLSATIKFEGSLILQAQGSGRLKTLVAQSTHDRKIRAIARSNEDVIAGTLSEMMGQGRLVITVEPQKKEPYQGIVPLEGENLAEVITHYFIHSEQLQTCVWLFANGTHAAGFLIQALPGEGNDPDDWERIITLANTITENEMMALDCEEILFRLFNEEKVRLFDPEPVEFECGCSRNKIEKTLSLLGREELESILQERSKIEVGCDFCGKQYSFDTVDVETLLAGQSIATISNTRH